MIGISERTTMDMDTTVRGIQMEEDDIVRIVKEILIVDVNGGIVLNMRALSLSVRKMLIITSECICVQNTAKLTLQ